MSARAAGASAPRVVVVAEFYPSRRDPVLGVWAHRQALAARDAGAEVRVLVLHRLVPPRAALRGRARRRRARARRKACASPAAQQRDGLQVTYVPYVSPARERGYPRWGAWAAPPLGLALRRLRRSFPFELVHAHNAVPAGDAVRLRRACACRWSSRSTAATCSTRRGAARAGAQARARAGWGRRGWCSPTARASPSSRARTAPRETRVVHLGADRPDARAAPGAAGAPRSATRRW